MLEGLVAWVINTYIGEYVENLNADQLSVGLLQGEVELENLPLKKDAFNFSNYPVEIRSGCIGRIRLQIPVYRLHSEPWVIFIEKLYVVVGPVSSLVYDKEKESKDAEQKKLAYLQDQETTLKASKDGNKGSSSYSVYSNWISYSTSFIANIIENIQLNIRDVHIRYEDDTCCKNKEFACGLVIRGLAAQSTDENWVPMFVKKDISEMTWKLAQLEGLSVYWDTNSAMLGNLPLYQMMEEMTKHLEVCISPGGATKNKEYIVSSVDAKARLKRNCSSQALKSPLNPRIVCDIHLEKIPLFFSQNQYQQISQWEKSFNWLCVKWQNRKWRPSVSVSDSPREWWKYAVTAYLEPLRPMKSQSSWDDLLQRARDVKEYHNIYLEYLKNNETLSQEMKIRKDQLERKLELEVLLKMRELVADEIQRKKPVSSSDSKEVANGGILQWMFPRWVGWYSSSATETKEKALSDANGGKETELVEEEILTVLNSAAVETFLKRDAMFIQLNFCLLKGSFLLLRNENTKSAEQSILRQRSNIPVIELEFSDVFIKLETKPRTRSLLFDLKLGALYVHDRMFNTSHFPHVIAAQSQESAYFTSPQPGTTLFPFQQPKLEESDSPAVSRWLFELLYEKNPQDVSAYYKLVIQTKPLDVICNLELIRTVMSIFTTADQDATSDFNVMCLPSVASVHYEHFKEHTKAELQHTWDRMLVGEKKSKKVWCVKLKISAPQIFVPENIFDPNTKVVIFVLGDLHAFNFSKERVTTVSFDSMESEDDFYTPLSTPEDFSEQQMDVDVSDSCNTEDLLLNRLYESYTLELQNMQVLVSSLKDSWKFAQLRGSSSLHILDRFSINIQIYRRTFLTEDPQWPSFVFIASLPKLTAHISEMKIGAVKACIEDLESYFVSGSSTMEDTAKAPKLQKIDESENNKVASKSGLSKSFFLMMQFSVDQMSFDIQSQSQSVAELQVAGVKTRFSMHHDELLLMLTVHSLLVVDALQTYGPDFELLVASHKSVGMDSMSGTITNRSCPDSLGSLSPPAPQQSAFITTGNSLPWSEEAPDDEALIFFEFESAHGNEEEELYSVNVKFNNLDIIANQETIIELVGLLKRIGIGGQKSHSQSLASLRSRSKSQMEIFLKKETSRFEVSFNFRLLNVLLLRAMSQSSVAQKLATATLNDAQIKAVIGSCTEISGTLGGIQVLDLATDGTKHQTVISLGNESPLLDLSCDFKQSLFADDAMECEGGSFVHALSFHIVQQDKESSTSDDTELASPSKDESTVSHFAIFLRMASLYYVHSPYMLYELSCCASEFKSYLKSLAYSIKTAATEMAKGIVNVHLTQLERDILQDPLMWSGDMTDEDTCLNLSCDIYVKSPVIVLPISTSSSDSFMAHLGHIALHNKSKPGSSTVSPPSLTTSIAMLPKEDVLYIDVSGMSLFYVNDKSESLHDQSRKSSVEYKSVGDLVGSEYFRCPIVHDTAIEVFVQPFQDTISFLFDSNRQALFSNDYGAGMKQVWVKAQVTSPLNVDFTKQHYEKMLQLLNSLSNSYQMPDGIVSLETTSNFEVSSSLHHKEMSISTSRQSAKQKMIISPQDFSKTFIFVSASLVLPSLKIELGEYINEKSSLASLTFQEFSMKYEQVSFSEVAIQATLSSLWMEDLQEHTYPTRTSLLISSVSKKKNSIISSVYIPPCLSSSCPDIYERTPEATYTICSPSLPDNLCTANMFSQQRDRKGRYGQKSSCKRLRLSSYPNTPPPSPSHGSSARGSCLPNSTLVTLNVVIIKLPPESSSSVKKKSLSVDLDFNCLDIIFSFQPWNVIFDFFCIGSTMNDEEQTYLKQRGLDESGSNFGEESAMNIFHETDIKVNVKSLTVVLSKPEYDLASANISDFSSHLSKTGEHFNLKGSLASISVLDLTPMGKLYPQRLINSGSEALQFNIFSRKPLASTSKKEICINGQLSSITYVHTQRLITEITVFFDYFHRKQFARSRGSSQLSVPCEPRCSEHGPHILFNMSAESPVIIIPADALSTNLLAIRLQAITLSNFVISDSSNRHDNITTKASASTTDVDLMQLEDVTCKEVEHTTCIDITALAFTGVTLYSGVRTSLLQDESELGDSNKILFPSFMVIPQVNLLKEAFTFQLEIERTVCAPVTSKESELKLGGMLSSVHATLDLEQYMLIRSVFQHNFGETLEEGIYDPCKEVSQFVLLDVNDEASPTMTWSIEVQNVTLELCANSQSPVREKNMLAKFDFIKSHLSYVVFSNNRKDIDFFSTEIRIFDVRYQDCPANKRPNVFTNILLPNKEGPSSTLQAELHYRLKNDLTKITILLNNMKVMGIMDFIQSTLGFLSSPMPSNNLYQQCPEPVPQVESYIEMKINVTDTEFVVVEDSSGLDSSAVIVKATAVIDWKPHDAEKPMSFNLQQFEMFSCILGVEDETALSIIDPASLCVDLVNKHSSPIARLQLEDEMFCVLEVSSSNLYMRFSYYDLVMFIKILESLKRQIGATQSQPSSAASVDAGDEVKALADLGFSVRDCQKALTACRGNLTDAALWLTQNATPAAQASYGATDSKPSPSNSTENKKAGLELKSMTFYSAELRIDSIGLCIIDDCREADVPVLEFHLADVCITQKLRGNQEGYGMFNFSVDYYNCSVSGWEPLIEPWRCEMKWNTSKSYEGSAKKLFFSITSEDVVNTNITSAFLKLFSMVKNNWTEDFSSRGCSNNGDSNINKTRLQLMPYVLKNKTGCRLWFATQVLTSRKFHSYQQSGDPELVWKSVENWETSLFTFGKRVKLRHQDSHQEMLHQIVVRVEGWQVALPVSVDRVGVYFRNISPKDNYGSHARIVFKVKLENNAQRSITVESAFSVINKLDDFLDVKLECPGLLYGVKEERLFVSPNETLPIPLPFVRSRIWMRPSDQSFSYCDSDVSWYDVTKSGEVVGFLKVCGSVHPNVKPCRFCVCVKRGNYPENGDQFQSSRDSCAPALFRAMASHTIIVLPCLEVYNFLPCDLKFSISDHLVVGSLKPGKKQSVCCIDIAKSFTFGVAVDNFKDSSSLNIYSASRHYPNVLELRDTQNRVLYLNLRVSLIASYAMQLVVYAPYWIVNKTGLPIVLKQDGTQVEAAGQFEENEIARSMSPLLFSFYDEDASAMCTMRIGKKLHSGGLPLWCSRFRLEKGIQVRRLQVARNDSRPDWVYNIGIEVVSGKGMCKDSTIVTLSPRYHLDNRSQHTLEFCQKFAINQNRNFVLSAVPGCSLPFHWPRIDLDNLLCVRIANIPDCHWSGGFSIGSIQSFFINMRDSDGTSHFLQMEVVLQGATFHVIFTDAASFPPPVRIDNCSEVSVTYYQTNVSEERLKTTVRPHTSVPYALDEPMLPPHITCSAPGGSTATYNMNIFREGSQLFYENFIYIAFTGTLTSGNDILGKSDACFKLLGNCMDDDLVLDVPSGTRVILSKKEPGKRSQLWRMTSGEMLQHEGSTPPCDLSKSHSSPSSVQKLVLDISGLGPQPGELIPLMLRKPDVRRHHTQVWRFTADGRLCCGYPNMYVQVKNGCLGLKAGSSVVLGPMPQFLSVVMENGIPIEQAVCRQKLRGGCGVLSVKVVPDGPTRVLKITDLKQKVPSDSKLEEADTKGSLAGTDHKTHFDIEKKKQTADRYELQFNLKLIKGIGISFVNHLNEDLIYIMMHDIMVEFCKLSSAITLDGSLKSIQVDNQLRETEWPVFLFVTPSSKSDSQRHLPAAHFTVHLMETSLANARIFKHFIVTLKNLTIYVEEILVLKLLQFFGMDESTEELEVNINDNELTSSLFRHVTKDPRYYFSTLKLCLQQVRLSVHTTDHLPFDLQQLKKKLGLRLISFEDAAINLDPFLKVHPFETSKFLIGSIVDHYKQELKSQAAKILGAVDFLGNPLGLMNDVTDGLAELIHEGSVGGLIKNVAHGLSDTAAKISESLSDSLGSVAIDERHQMMRRQIRQGSSSQRNNHLMAGFRGLGIGLLGGVTSIFTETYEGATQEGIQGFLAGVGKGLVGTVAKPAVGFLDLASGAASAVRDTSRRSLAQPHRRPPRMTVGHGGLLPTYSLSQALDQELLYSLNSKKYSELFIAKEVLHSRAEDLQVLVSSEKVYFLNVSGSSSNKIVLIVSLGDLLDCCYVQSRSGAEPRHYIQLHIKEGSSSRVKLSNCQKAKKYSLLESDEWSCKKPQVRCDHGEVAEKVVMQIHYAKSLHEEQKYIVLDDDEDLVFLQ